MEWQKDFEVGHAKTDLEHRMFFNLLQEVIAAQAEGLSRDKIRQLFIESIKYAEFHFVSEENFMMDIGYPEFEQHRKAHKSFISALQKNMISFESGDDNVQGLVDVLTNWRNHTVNEDSRLSKYVAQVKNKR